MLRFQLTGISFCGRKTDRLEPTCVIQNSKQTSFGNHDLLELSEALHLPEGFCYSQRQKEVEGILNVKEKLISQLNLNLFFLHDSSLSMTAAHFFIVSVQVTKESHLFRPMQLDTS